MSIIPKNQIVEAISCGELVFEPALDQFQLSPIAVDLRVGHNFFVPKLSQITESGREEMAINQLDDTTKSEIFDQFHMKDGQCFELLPGEFILISSLEKIKINSKAIMATLFARSSTSRRGLSIESGIIDPLYEGILTIPVLNKTKTQTIKIFPGERIAQLVFNQVNSGLTKEDAESHGISKPKYQGAKSYTLDYRFDAHDEINLLREGKVEEIKKKYPINLKKSVTEQAENKLEI